MNEIVKSQPSITIRLDRNPVAVYIASLGTQNSREGVKWALDLAAAVLSSGRCDAFSLDWSQLRYQHIAALKSKLISADPTPRRSQPYSLSTTNLVLSTVKGVMKHCKKLKLITPEDLNDIMEEKAVRGQALPSGRALTPQEVRALFNACGDGISGIRDRAVLAILLGAGLRRSELSALDRRDWHESDLLIVVRRGKGRKAREVPVGTRVASILSGWLEIRGDEPGALITSVRSGMLARMMRLGDTGIYFVLERRSKDAGILKVSPHDCRRTYITNLLLNGADLAIAAKLAVHASVETTANYDRRGIDSMREAAEGLMLPI